MKLKLFQKQPDYTDDVVRLEDIKIPTEFTKCLPSKDKIIKKSKYYKKHKVLEHSIEVRCELNEKGRPNKLTLTDGYISYLILLFNGEDYAPVRYLYV